MIADRRKLLVIGFTAIVLALGFITHEALTREYEAFSDVLKAKPR